MVEVRFLACRLGLGSLERELLDDIDKAVDFIVRVVVNQSNSHHAFGFKSHSFTELECVIVPIPYIDSVFTKSTRELCRWNVSMSDREGWETFVKSRQIGNAVNLNLLNFR